MNPVNLSWSQWVSSFNPKERSEAKYEKWISAVFDDMPPGENLTKIIKAITENINIPSTDSSLTSQKKEHINKLIKEFNICLKQGKQENKYNFIEKTCKKMIEMSGKNLFSINNWLENNCSSQLRKESSSKPITWYLETLLDRLDEVNKVKLVRSLKTELCLPETSFSLNGSNGLPRDEVYLASVDGSLQANHQVTLEEIKSEIAGIKLTLNREKGIKTSCRVKKRLIDLDDDTKLNKNLRNCISKLIAYNPEEDANPNEIANVFFELQGFINIGQNRPYPLEQDELKPFYEKFNEIDFNSLIPESLRKFLDTMSNEPSINPEIFSQVKVKIIDQRTRNQMLNDLRQQFLIGDDVAPHTQETSSLFMKNPIQQAAQLDSVFNNDMFVESFVKRGKKCLEEEQGSFELLPEIEKICFNSVKKNMARLRHAFLENQERVPSLDSFITLFSDMVTESAGRCISDNEEFVFTKDEILERLDSLSLHQQAPTQEVTPLLKKQIEYYLIVKPKKINSRTLKEPSPHNLFIQISGAKASAVVIEPVSSTPARQLFAMTPILKNPSKIKESNGVSFESTSEKAGVLNVDLSESDSYGIELTFTESVSQSWSENFNKLDSWKKLVLVNNVLNVTKKQFCIKDGIITVIEKENDTSNLEWGINISKPNPTGLDALNAFVSNKKNAKALNYISLLIAQKPFDAFTNFQIYKNYISVFGKENPLTLDVFSELLIAFKAELLNEGSSETVNLDGVQYICQNTSGAGNSCGLHAIYGKKEGTKGKVILHNHSHKRTELAEYVENLYPHQPEGEGDDEAIIELDKNLFNCALESYSNYEHLYSQLVSANRLAKNPLFSALTPPQKKLLPYWSETLFNFVRVNFNNRVGLDERVNQGHLNLKTVIVAEINSIEGETDRKTFLNSFISETTQDLEWNLGSLTQLVAPEEDSYVKKAATELRGCQTEKDESDKQLVKTYLQTIFRSQVCQENYPLTNSELALMFLADPEKQTNKLAIYSANQERFIEYFKSNYAEDAPIKFVHHHGFHYSRLILKQAEQEDSGAISDKSESDSESHSGSVKSDSNLKLGAVVTLKKDACTPVAKIKEDELVDSTVNHDEDYARSMNAQESGELVGPTIHNALNPGVTLEKDGGTPVSSASKTVESRTAQNHTPNPNINVSKPETDEKTFKYFAYKELKQQIKKERIEKLTLEPGNELGFFINFNHLVKKANTFESNFSPLELKAAEKVEEELEIELIDKILSSKSGLDKEILEDLISTRLKINRENPRSFLDRINFVYGEIESLIVNHEKPIDDEPCSEGKDTQNSLINKWKILQTELQIFPTAQLELKGFERQFADVDTYLESNLKTIINEIKKLEQSEKLKELEKLKLESDSEYYVGDNYSRHINSIIENLERKIKALQEDFQKQETEIDAIQHTEDITNENWEPESANKVFLECEKLIKEDKVKEAKDTQEIELLTQLINQCNQLKAKTYIDYFEFKLKPVFEQKHSTVISDKAITPDQLGIPTHLIQPITADYIYNTLNHLMNKYKKSLPGANAEVDVDGPVLRLDDLHKNPALKHLQTDCLEAPYSPIRVVMSYPIEIHNLQFITLADTATEEQKLKAIEILQNQRDHLKIYSSKYEYSDSLDKEIETTKSDIKKLTKEKAETAWNLGLKKFEKKITLKNIENNQKHIAELIASINSKTYELKVIQNELAQEEATLAETQLQHNKILQDLILNRHDLHRFTNDAELKKSKDLILDSDITKSQRELTQKQTLLQETQNQKGKLNAVIESAKAEIANSLRGIESKDRLIAQITKLKTVLEIKRLAINTAQDSILDALKNLSENQEITKLDETDSTRELKESFRGLNEEILQKEALLTNLICLEENKAENEINLVQLNQNEYTINEDIAALNQGIQTQTQEQQTLRQEWGIVNTSIIEVNAQIQNNTNTIQDLKANITEKEETIAQKKEAIATKETEKTTLTAQKVKEEKIKTGREQKAESLNKDIDALNEQIEELTITLERLEATRKFKETEKENIAITKPVEATKVSQAWHKKQTLFISDSLRRKLFYLKDRSSHSDTEKYKKLKQVCENELYLEAFKLKDSTNTYTGLDTLVDYFRNELKLLFYTDINELDTDELKISNLFSKNDSVFLTNLENVFPDLYKILLFRILDDYEFEFTDSQIKNAEQDKVPVAASFFAKLNTLKTQALNLTSGNNFSDLETLLEYPEVDSQDSDSSSTRQSSFRVERTPLSAGGGLSSPRQKSPISPAMSAMTANSSCPSRIVDKNIIVFEREICRLFSLNSIPDIHKVLNVLNDFCDCKTEEKNTLFNRIFSTEDINKEEYDRYIKVLKNVLKKFEKIMHLLGDSYTSLKDSVAAIEKTISNKIDVELDNLSKVCPDLLKSNVFSRFTKSKSTDTHTEQSRETESVNKIKIIYKLYVRGFISGDNLESLKEILKKPSIVSLNKKMPILELIKLNQRLFPSEGQNYSTPEREVTSQELEQVRFLNTLQTYREH